jgi:hypothetical protein
LPVVIICATRKIPVATHGSTNHYVILWFRSLNIRKYDIKTIKNNNYILLAENAEDNLETRDDDSVRGMTPGTPNLVIKWIRNIIYKEEMS